MPGTLAILKLLRAFKPRQRWPFILNHSLGQRDLPPRPLPWLWLVQLRCGLNGLGDMPWGVGLQQALGMGKAFLRPEVLVGTRVSAVQKQLWMFAVACRCLGTGPGGAWAMGSIRTGPVRKAGARCHT